MSIFQHPQGLVLVAHFAVPRVQTWGRKDDQEYKSWVRRASGLSASDAASFAWFVFCIRCVVGKSRATHEYQVPDVENMPKLIVDAFNDVLYLYDNLHHVRGVQVEAGWGPDDQEQAEVWIYGRERHHDPN